MNGLGPWTVERESCFGGEREGLPNAQVAAANGLTVRQGELLAHIPVHTAAGDKRRAATVERQLLRTLAGNAKLLQEVEKHLKQAR